MGSEPAANPAARIGRTNKMLFPIASGYWNNDTSAGVFHRNWNNNRSNDNNNVGFRASDYAACPTFWLGNTGDIGVASSCDMAKSARRSVLVSSENVHYA